MSIMNISDWVYRGEGNASLVITNTKEYKVYKLRKTKYVKADCNVPVSKSDADCSYQMCSRMLRYSEHVLRPLLGEQFVPIAEIVPISTDFIKRISDKVMKCRPSKRLNTEIGKDTNYGICLPDLCFIKPTQWTNSNPVFCIEIKPKMGFLPDSKLISQDRSIKKSACKFCMYQKLKVEHGTWDSSSKYCPLDLFSGNEDRMMYALCCLIKTPQNNLKVFMNGQLIFANNGRNMPTSKDHQQLIDILKSHFGSKTTTIENERNDLNNSCLQNFLHLIQKVLVVSEEGCESRLRGCCTEPHTVPVVADEGCESRLRGCCTQPQTVPVVADECCEARLSGFCTQPYTTKQCLESNFKPNTASRYVSSRLPSGCILERILKVQQFDDLDIEGIYPLYQRLLKHTSEHPEDSEKYCLEGPFSQLFIDQLPKMNQSTREKGNCIVESTLDYAVQRIREYLIAGTAKDCSVMITMQKAMGPQSCELLPHISSSNGDMFAYQCSIVDLDPKPSTRIPMYYKLDQDIIQYYKKYREQQDISS